MRFKKFASLAVASAMTMSLLAGCGDTGTGSTETELRCSPVLHFRRSGK